MHKLMVQWLYGQLPELVRGGVLDEAAASRIRAHYGDVFGRASKPGAWLLAVFGVIGGALIALGIILLFAHNWDELSRPVRAVVSFLPLLAGQALTAWTLARRKDSLAFREGAGTFLTLAIGACIALIAQTYQIPGNLANFLFTWTILALPIAYLLQATVPAMLYMAGITAWAITERVDRGNVHFYWLLLVLILPYLWSAFRHRPQSPSSVWLAWGASICACIVIPPLMIVNGLPGMGLLAYSAMLGAFFLSGATLDQDAARWKLPFAVVGVVGTVIVMLVMTYTNAWEEIWCISDGDLWDVWPNIVLVVALYICVVLLLIRHFVDMSFAVRAFGACAPLALAGYLVALASHTSEFSAYTFNAYMLALAIGLMVQGARTDRLAVLNGGMGIFALWITARFFDADLSFLWRGILFIVLGAAFLAANMVILSRRRRAS